jgi:hypothetical protein
VTWGNIADLAATAFIAHSLFLLSQPLDVDAAG